MFFSFLNVLPSMLVIMSVIIIQTCVRHKFSEDTLVLHWHPYVLHIAFDFGYELQAIQE